MNYDITDLVELPEKVVNCRWKPPKNDQTFQQELRHDGSPNLNTSFTPKYEWICSEGINYIGLETTLVWILMILKLGTFFFWFGGNKIPILWLREWTATTIVQAIPLPRAKSSTQKGWEADFCSCPRNFRSGPTFHGPLNLSI